MLVEELYATDTSAALTIFATGLGLHPLIAGGTEEQKVEFFKLYLSGEGSVGKSVAFCAYRDRELAREGRTGVPNPSTTGRKPKLGHLQRKTFAIPQLPYLQYPETDTETHIQTSNSSGWEDKSATPQCVVRRCVQNCENKNKGPIIRSVFRNRSSYDKKSAFPRVFVVV
jgi:hypothetical protein